MIVLGGQQRASAIHIHVSILPQTPLPSRLQRNVEQSSDAEQGSVGLLGMEVFLSPIPPRQDSSPQTFSEFSGLDWATELAETREAARKPPEAKLKGPERLFKTGRWDLRPCTHPNLVSNPTLLKQCRKRNEDCWGNEDCYCLDPYPTPQGYITSPYSPGRGHRFLREEPTVFPLCLAK